MEETHEESERGFMQARTDDVSAMLGMQHIDFELMRAKKRYDELPQRGIIMQAREKKRVIEQKREQLDGMHSAAASKFSRISDEDALLADKQKRVQDEIDAARGDYRSVEARTKELNGFAKRRNVLEEDLTKLGEELSKIEKVQAQVARALVEFDRQESEATEAFRKEGGDLKNQIAQLEAQRAPLVSALPPELATAYDRAAEQGNGVAIGRLHDGCCGVCRAVIDKGRLIDLKAQAPLAVCPNCNRLLVVE